MTDRIEVFVVDRAGGAILILVPVVGPAQEVPRAALPGDVGEGAVLRVPLDADGSPVWAQATRDRDREETLLQEGRDRLEALKKRDPGGDIVL